MFKYIVHFVLIGFVALTSVVPSSVKNIFIKKKPYPKLAQVNQATQKTVLGENTKKNSKNDQSSIKDDLLEGEIFFNVPAVFNQNIEINGKTTFTNTINGVSLDLGLGKITASNILYKLKEGDGISISGLQTPTISNTGVTSLQGKTGSLTFTAGSGIGIDGLTLTNSDLGSSQNIFKTISVSGQSDVTTDTNSDTLTFAGSGVTITTDVSNDKITFSADTPDYTQSGWTDGGTSLYLTTITDKVGIGTASPSTALHVVGATTLAGDLTIGSSSTDSITFTARVANGSSILPDTDLGSDLGSSSLRFNNIWTANLNSNSSQSFSGQTTFSYAPTDTTIDEASVLINPTTSAASGQLLGLAIAGYQKALIDEDGDIILGYSDATSAPASDYPLNIYGHSGTRVSFVDTTGNGYFAGNVGIGTSSPATVLDVNGTITTTSITRGVDSATLSVNGATDNEKGANIALYGRDHSALPGNAYITYGGYDATGMLQIRRVNTGGTFVNLMKFDNSGNVGIGTTSPNDKLEVVSTSDTQLRLAYDTSNYHALQVAGDGGLTWSALGTDADLNFDFSGATDGDFSVNTNDLFVDTSSGYVGIGTTGPAYNLHLVAPLYNSTSIRSEVQTNGGYNSTLSLVGGKFGYSAIYFGDLDNNSIGSLLYSHTNDSLRFQTNSSTQLTIISSGNVGIGTASPTSLLSVGSTSQFQVDSNGIITSIDGVAHTIDDVSGDLTLTSNSSNITLNDNVTFAGTTTLNSIAYTWPSTQTADYVLQTNGSGTLSWVAQSGGSLPSGSSGQTLRHNGTGWIVSSLLYNDGTYIGVNNASPNALLDIGNTSGTTLLLTDSDSVANSDYNLSIDFYNQSNSATIAKIGPYTSSTSDFYIQNSIAGGLAFQTNGANTRMFVDSSGNVGIGTTSPTSLLHLTGAVTGKALAIFDETGDQDIFTASASGTTKFVIDNSGNVGIGTTAPGYKLQVGASGDGTVAIANAWNTFSDIRFKENIHTIDSALDKVLRLEGVYYDWKNSGETTLGFIAQNVQPILPEIVSQDKEGYLSLDYSRFTPLLVEAVKEQNNLINKNELQINKLGDIVFSSTVATDSAIFANTQKISNNQERISNLSNQISAIEDVSSSSSAEINSLIADISSIKIDLSLLKGDILSASTSALLDQSKNNFTGSDSATLSKLVVLNDANINNLSVIGKINNGLLVIDGLSDGKASISSLATPLEIQDNLSADVKIMGGKITIDKKGNLIIKEGKIVGNDQFRGKVTVKSGEKSINIERSWENAPTAITITTNYDSYAWVKDISSNGFTIHLKNAPTEDSEVYWIAIW